MRRVLAAATVSAVTALLPGCSSSTGAADCSTTVRYEGDVYRESGFTDTVAEEIGTADLADCDDVGVDAKGSHFPDNPEQVTVWSIPGKDSAQVIVIAYPDGGYRVMKLVDDK